ncbi:MAG: peptidylprolyl isomerase [Archangium gephyra]|uniref:Peptidyl-prolyl cis-trans isomerase n=1 Tax=Archangium gephyra TaxID=48 RepID=A0A2W5V2V4_9BACT|nr:MAG: peptidylprolyl isomerase [Archangium gephyra]
MLAALLLLACSKKELKPRNPQPPVTSPTGVITQVLREGYDDGDVAKKGDKISIHFTGTLTDGGVFDSSYQRGAFNFWVGEGMVVPGLDQGLLGMKEGEARLITIPPLEGYANDAKPGIPPRSTLVFEVELLDVR